MFLQYRIFFYRLILYNNINNNIPHVNHLQISIFLYCSPFNYRSLNFAVAKVVDLPSFASFLHQFSTFIHRFFFCITLRIALPTYAMAIVVTLFSIIKAIAKIKGTLIAIAFKSDNYRLRDKRQSDNYRKGNKGKEQRN